MTISKDLLTEYNDLAENNKRDPQQETRYHEIVDKHLDDLLQNPDAIQDHLAEQKKIVAKNDQIVFEFQSRNKKSR